MIKPKQHWIGVGIPISGPMFRREFTCDHPLTGATLLISGLGYHDAWINGKRVGDHVLDPSQTDYESRVFYVRHDVTKMLYGGPNALGVILGNGWYNQDRVWGENGLSYGPPRLMAELHLTYADGTTGIIRADTDWRWAPGPITDNNVYAGECYDARLEIDGWCLPGFDDSTWQAAVIMDPPGGELQEQIMPPMRRIDGLRPVNIDDREDGIYVVDFGQNFAGWCRIQVEGSGGTEITLRYAETVFPDGTLDTSTTGVFATKVEQVDRYICRGPCGQSTSQHQQIRKVSTLDMSNYHGTASHEKATVWPETWEPRFTYHGFRYVEVSGWPGDLRPENITGVIVHNDLPAVGRFECSDDRLNQLHRMALWTHRGNMHGIPEDCPAREKCGWLGDANLVAEYSLWNYGGKTFWEKYLVS
ncbi:MAG: family 78 glycoside hydrolase catalytic domain [Lentisphaeria bacterium]|nr:family 78 glycoside hydrolase catalytic domain [Lentisphaeria bacterium]